MKWSQNCKGVEVTYAKAEVCREFLKSVQEDNTEDCKNCDISQVLILYIVMISKKCCWEWEILTWWIHGDKVTKPPNVNKHFCGSFVMCYRER